MRTQNFWVLCYRRLIYAHFLYLMDFIKNLLASAVTEILGSSQNFWCQAYLNQ